MAPKQPQIQKQGNFFEAMVPPLALTNSLKIGPGKYSLGVDSTIPFVSLQGGGSSQKIFTWGEMIEVFPGQLCTVKNESFMQGDIQINSGWDYAATPPKISLPVDTDVTVNGGVTNISGRFPADTRRCRRAYLKSQISTDTANGSLTIIGKPNKHSYPATDGITGQNNYQKIIALIPFTSYSEFSLGFSFEETEVTPMGLTDQVSFLFAFNEGVVFNNVFFYVLEY